MPSPRRPSSERARMISGAPYDSRDPDLLARAHEARALLARFAALAPTDADGRRAVLEALLGRVSDDVWIEPPFFCDYGEQIEIGEGTFVNVNVVMLDSAPIRVGARGLIGPATQIHTASHPLRAADRVRPPGASGAPYVTTAAPVTIGDEVWIGGGVVIRPGVEIGPRTTIGAGSVVTEDVPADVFAAGAPCRVIRRLDLDAPNSEEAT